MLLILLAFIIIMQCNTTTEGHLSKLELPEYNGERCTPLNNGTHSNDYEFVPGSTIVGFVFVGLWLSFIITAKIMGNSSDKYKMNNKFDLVIFKPASTSSKQDSLIGSRRVLSTNNVYAHNINAAAVCGFDFSQMNARTTYTDIFHTNSNETNLGTPVFTNSSSLSKL